MGMRDDRAAAAGAVPALPVLDLGIAPYAPLQELQGRLRTAVADGMLPGVILLLEHEPVITLGNRGVEADLRDPALALSRGVEVVTSERGGQATLHAPGQLILYPIVRIPRRDLRAFVRDLEEVFLVVLAAHGVAAHRRDGHPGLYVSGAEEASGAAEASGAKDVSGAKIMSVGLRCHRWVASHGASFNVSVDLSLFDLVVSCGEAGLRQTSLDRLTGRAHAMGDVKMSCLDAMRRVFGWELAPPLEVPYTAVQQALGLRP